MLLAGVAGLALATPLAAAGLVLVRELYVKDTPGSRKASLVHKGISYSTAGHLIYSAKLQRTRDPAFVSSRLHSADHLGCPFGLQLGNLAPELRRLQLHRGFHRPF